MILSSLRLITILGILLYLLCLSNSDNPTAIVKPYDGPDPGYILAESDGGLSVNHTVSPLA